MKQVLSNGVEVELAPLGKDLREDLPIIVVAEPGPSPDPHSRAQDLILSIDGKKTAILIIPSYLKTVLALGSIGISQKEPGQHPAPVGTEYVRRRRGSADR
jgi:hypothetical protein